MGPRSNKKGKPKKFSVERRTLKRRPPTRTVRKSILIVCEDSKSSCDYFMRFHKELSLSSVHVEVCGKECGSDPMSVVTFAKQKKDTTTSTIRDAYDEIFCVVDVDEHTNLKDAIQTATDNHLDLIITNPCFEYWYLLHFTRSGAAITDRPKLRQDLSKLLGRKYEKSGCDFFDVLYPKTDTAIRNAQEILASQWQYEQDPTKCNPSTQVHRIIESIKKLAE